MCCMFATIATWQTTLNTHVVIPTNTTKTHVNANAGIQVRFHGWSHENTFLGFVKSGVWSLQRSWTQRHIRSGQTSRAQTKCFWTCGRLISVSVLGVFLLIQITAPWSRRRLCRRRTAAERRHDTAEERLSLRMESSVHAVTVNYWAHQQVLVTFNSHATPPQHQRGYLKFPCDPAHQYITSCHYGSFLTRICRLSGGVAVVTPRAQTCTNRTISQQIRDFPRQKHSWSTSVHFFTARKQKFTSVSFKIIMLQNLKKI